jgi:hypothetical protein
MRLSVSSRRPRLVPVGCRTSGKHPYRNATVSSFASPAPASFAGRAEGRTGPLIEVHGRGVFSAGWHAGSGLNPEGEVWTMKA